MAEMLGSLDEYDTPPYSIFVPADDGTRHGQVPIGSEETKDYNKHTHNEMVIPVIYTHLY